MSPEILVTDRSVVLKPDNFKATPVKVPKLLSNRPKTPVWLMSVVCNGLLKLKLTVAALELSARAVPTTKDASDFIGSSSSHWSAVWRRLIKHK